MKVIKVSEKNTATLGRGNSLPSELLHRMNAYWRAANYLSVGQIYLYENPLLKKPLKLEHVRTWDRVGLC